MNARPLTCAIGVVLSGLVLALSAPAQATMTVFDYGVVSAGPISLSGNAQITGGT
jgi:hypothetical protein